MKNFSLQFAFWLLPSLSLYSFIFVNFEKNYYLCKHRCPRCFGSIFREDRYMDTRFYCEKCDYAVEAMDKVAFKDKMDN